MRYLAFFFLCILPTNQYVQAQEKQIRDPRMSVDTLIPHAMKLLKEKKYAELIRSCIPPEELKMIQERDTLDDVIKEFSESDKPEALMDALKQAMKSEPKYNNEKTEATFSLKKAKNGKDVIVFKKSGELWYISN